MVADVPAKKSHVWQLRARPTRQRRQRRDVRRYIRRKHARVGLFRLNSAAMNNSNSQPNITGGTRTNVVRPRRLTVPLTPPGPSMPLLPVTVTQPEASIPLVQEETVTEEGPSMPLVYDEDTCASQEDSGDRTPSDIEAELYGREEDSLELPPTKSSVTRDIQDKIVEWYREHPLFYDKTHVDYKNKEKKDRILTDFAKSLGMISKYNLILIVVVFCRQCFFHTRTFYTVFSRDHVKPSCFSKLIC